MSLKNSTSNNTLVDEYIPIFNTDATYWTSDFIYSPKEDTLFITDYLTWSFVATAIYALSYIIILIILACKTHGCQNAWNQKSIYASILNHLYDTSTDIGVLVEWGFLAYDNIDYESIDMRAMFWASFGIQILYRTVSGISAARHQSKCPYFFMGFLDVYIYKPVEHAMEHQYSDTEADEEEVREFQLLEAVFESLPQVS